MAAKTNNITAPRSDPQSQDRRGEEFSSDGRTLLVDLSGIQQADYIHVPSSKLQRR
jgi:hypothetical protein